MNRSITIFSPQIGTSALSIDAASPYEAVEKARTDWKNNLTDQTNPYKDFEIDDVMPVHNPSGIRDQSQIGQMRQGIVAGKEINERNDFPNIKLVVAPNKKLLLFDGTHSLLAYFHEGKRKLGEVSFLIICGENNEAITEQEIANFFPPEERAKVIQDWEKYVVNWQAAEGKQLEIREVETIGDLANQLGEG